MTGGPTRKRCCRNWVGVTLLFSLDGLEAAGDVPNLRAVCVATRASRQLFSEEHHVVLLDGHPFDFGPAFGARADDIDISDRHSESQFQTVG